MLVVESDFRTGLREQRKAERGPGGPLFIDTHAREK